jgi:aldehyde dehydrogenase (NAD+)
MIAACWSLLGLDPAELTGASQAGKQPAADDSVSLNPATGEELGRIAAVSRAEYDLAVEQAQTAFLTWRETPAPQRGEVVRQLGEELRRVKEPLGMLITLETGKIRSEGLGEVQEMIDICDFAVGLSRQLYGLTIASERPDHRLYEQWRPLGPIGVITAFNFPTAVWAWNAALAAVCGDPVLWKPSELTPLTALAVTRLVERVTGRLGLSGLFPCLFGGRDVGKWLAEDPRLPLISATGSCAMGRSVAQAVAGRLGRSLLELGGNNALIVTPSADLKLAVRAILFAAVGTAGQRCTTLRRLIVHESIRDELAARLSAAYTKIPLGNPWEEGVLLGPLIRPQAVARYLAALQTAREAGAQVVCGGRVLDRPGFFVEPTLVLARPDLAVVREETFAPILYLHSYRELEEAIAIQNGVPQGLSSAIFTDSVREAERFLSPSGSDCGIANVNIGTSGAEIGGAFGGEKETGGGRESGSDAWKAYMRRQTCTINYGRSLPLAQGVVFGD